MASGTHVTGFHSQELLTNTLAESLAWAQTDTKFTYTFHNFFHPYVGELIAKLNRESLAKMLDPVWQEDELHQTFFNSTYHPRSNNLVSVTSFPKEIDVS